MQKLMLLGRGGVGEVWLLQDIISQRQYAGKCTSKELDLILRHEAMILKSLHHPGIPRYLGLCSLEDTAVLCMEYIAGITLRDFIQRYGACGKKRTIQIAYELLDILHYLHHHDIIHGDLKLQNIMITKEFHIYVLDFGSACMHGKAPMGIYGTIAYAAPEQIVHGICNEQTDIYAFGKVLYALLLGIYEVEQLQDIQLASLTYPWRFLLELCLDENPFLRFAHVEEIQMYLYFCFHHNSSKLLYIVTSACFLLVWMRIAI